MAVADDVNPTQAFSRRRAGHRHRNTHQEWACREGVRTVKSYQGLICLTLCSETFISAKVQKADPASKV